MSRKAVPIDENHLELYDITALTPQQQRFIHLYLTGAYKLIEIAQLLGVTSKTVGEWLKLPLVQKIIGEYQIDEHNAVATSIKALTMKAVNKLSDLVDSPIDGVALNAVKDILDRSGHKALQTINVNKTITKREEMMNNLIDNTIDAEYTFVEDEDD